MSGSSSKGIGGASIGTAGDLGSLTASGSTFGDFIGMAFPNDWYRFTLSSLSSVNLGLLGLSSSATLTLADANGHTIATIGGSGTNIPQLLFNLTAGTYFVHVANASDTAFTLTASATTLSDAGGRSFATAKTLAAPTSTVATITDWVGAAAPDDYYSFTLTAAAYVNLGLSGLASNGATFTLYDASGNQINSTTGGPTGNALLAGTLGAGTYYIRINDTADTTYTLSLSSGAPTVGTASAADGAGNSFAAAKVAGALTTTAKTYADYVKSTDTDDYYKFTVSALSTVSAQLSGLVNGESLALYASDGTQLVLSGGAPGTPGSILANLAAGTYYVDIGYAGVGDSGYSLSLAATALPNAVGTSKSAATSLTLGSTPVIKSDWVGLNVPDDWYSFTTTGVSAVSLQVSGTAIDTTFTLYDSAGNQLNAGNITGLVRTVNNLAAGTYYVDVNEAYGTSYTLTASASALPNAGGGSLATATNLGALGTTVTTTSDWIGAAAPDDWYKVTVSALSTITVQLSGLTSTFNYATLELVNSSGNTVVSTYGYAYNGSGASLLANVVAGTYYIHINDTNDTTYSLSASAAVLPNAAATSIGAASASVGTVGATAITLNDWVGGASPTDYYRFTISGAGTSIVNLRASTANFSTATITLLDTNGNQIDSSSDGIGGRTTLVDALSAGTYFAVVSDSNDTAYSLSLVTGAPTVGTAGTDAAGNSFAAARAVGALGATTLTYADYIGASDPVDDYQFSVTGPTTVTLQAGGTTTGTEYLTLFDANGATLGSTPVYADNNGLIRVNLATGIYYAQLSSPNGDNSGYSLSLSAAALANATGTTQATATSLGALGTTAVTKSDWIGRAAPDDWYQFTVASLSTVSLSFTGVLNDADILTLLDANGNAVGSSNGVSYGANGPTALTATLAAGTYYVHLNDTSDTAYTLSAISATAAATAPVNPAGRSFATATSLGALGTTAVSRSDIVGAAVPDEWYKFTVGALSAVSVGVSGLLSTATLTLTDANGAAITSQQGGPAVAAGVLADLAAGTYYLHLNDVTDTPFSLTATATALPDAVGHTLATAKALPAPIGTAATVTDWVGAAAPDDFYSFSLTSSATVNLALSGLASSATLTLYDATGAQVASASGDTGANALISANMAAGTYYIDVNDASDTTYALSLSTGAATVGTSSSADGAGNTTAAAKAVGTLTSTPATYADYISSSDTNDYYKFTVSAPSTVSLQTAGLSTFEVLHLYDSSGNQIGYSFNQNNNANSNSITANLAAGTYYADVSYSGYGNSGYSLSLSATALPNATGTTLAAATNLGTLSSTAVAALDWVGAAAPDDWYKVTASALSTLSVALSAPAAGAESIIVTLLDGNGNVLNTDNGLTTLGAVVGTVAAGTYYLHVTGFGTGTTYSLTAAATAVADTVGKTLATATSLGALGTTAVARTDWVGGAALTDDYQFTLASLSTVSLLFTGTSNDNDTLTILDASGKVISTLSGTGNSGPTSLKAMLGAGTYYVSVTDTADTAYTLTASSSTAAATAPVIPAGRTLATANALGALAATAVSRNDIIGTAAPDDWYAFTVGALSSVTVNLAGVTANAGLTITDASGNAVSTATAYPTGPGTLVTNLAAGTYYAHVHGTTDTRFTLTAAATALPNTAGHSFATATALAAPTTTPASVSDFVGAAAPNDYYTFSLTAAATVNLQLSGVPGEATLYLYDANGTLIDSDLSSPAYYAMSQGIAASLSESLAAGQYYVGVGAGYYQYYTNNTSETPYSLTVSTGKPSVGTSSAADGAGNSTAAAKAVGALTSTPKAYADFVGASDNDDYYQVTLSALSTLSVKLSGLSAPETVKVYYSDGSSVAAYDPTSNVGTPNSPTVLSKGLAAGTYYVDVTYAGYGDSGYNLSLAATALPNAVTTTQSTSDTSLGTLGTTTVTKSDWVGQAAPDDWYKFSVTGPASVYLQLSGLVNANVGATLTLYDASNNQINATSTFTESYNESGNSLVVSNLATGTYYVDVNYGSNYAPYAADTSYTLTASASALPNAGGGSLATATNLGALGTTVTTTSDWIGAAAPDDWYKVTVSALSTITVQLSGLTSTFNYATLELVNSSGNTVVSTYGYAYNGSGASLLANVVAGTYYIHINDTNDTTYSLSASAAVLPNAAATSIGAASASVGTVGATAITLNDWVGGASPTDYYRFTISGAGTSIVNLRASTANFSTATITLLDTNGNQIDSSSDGIGGRTTLVDALSAGTYFAVVSDSNDTAYSLSLVTGAPTVGTAGTDAAGNSFAAARAVGALGATTLTYADYIGASDPVDDYQFSVTGPTTVTLQAGGTTTGTEYLTLFDANGATLGSTPVYADNNGLIRVNLATGIYYAQLSSPNGDNSGYSLSLSAAALANATGTTQATATSLGALGTTAVTKSDWIGRAAPDDWYQFTVASLSTVSLSFTGVLNDADILTLLDANGNAVGSSNGVSYGANGPTALTATLAAGTYYVHLNDTSDTAYTLSAISATAAATAPVNPAGRSFATATSLGALGTTAVSRSDIVGAAVPDEWYKFTVGALSAVSLTSSIQSSAATLTLVDANGNVITSFTGSPDCTVALLADLAAGTYYAHVNDASDTAFTLTATATALPDAVGHTLATAKALPAPTGTAATVTDWVGAAAPDDWYSFSVASAATLNVAMPGINNGGSLSLYDASGNLIGSDSGNTGSNGLALTESLGAGTYYAQVHDTNDTTYALTLSTGAATVGTSGAADGAGNTLAAAKVIGTLTSTPTTFADYISSGDPKDYYKFTVSALSTVSAKLSGLINAEDLSLFDSAGNPISPQGFYDSPDTHGALIENLAAGTYYAYVNYYAGNSGYSLSLSAAALPNATGTTLAAATSLGTLGSAATTASDWIGYAAPDDWYKFTLSALSNVIIGLSGASGNPTSTLLDAAGHVIDADNYYDQGTLADALAAGTYYIHVNSTTDSTYALSANATPLADVSASTFAGATSLGTIGTASVSDSLSQPAPTDVYSFQVADQRNITLQLAGLTAGAVLTLYDTNQTQIASANGAANSLATITQLLAAGRYYLAVTDGGSVNTPYTLTANAIGLSVANASVVEGNAGTTTNEVFTVKLSSTSSVPVTVKYATGNVSATAGSDYTATSGTLTIAAGQTSGTISVPVIGDNTVEPNETFALTLSNPTGASFAGNAASVIASGTIVNDDVAVATIGNVSTTEGNSGTTNAAFTVNLSNPSSTPVTIVYATSDGTATAGSDYTASSGTLTIAAGQTSGTINVPVTGDNMVEPNETYTVTLSSPSGASFTGGASTATATGTIVNDDVAVATIGNVSTTEGNSGMTNAAFTVNLSNPSSTPVTIAYATSNGTATAGSDYTATSGTLTIAAGQTSGTINVPVTGDNMVEPNETYTVTLSSPSGASFTGGASTATATGTIVNDDVAVATIGNVSTTEGNSGTTNAAFTVNLSNPSSTPVTIAYATSNGTATAGSDYTATSGTLTIAAGQTSGTINVPILGDATPEPNETYTVTLSNPSGASFTGGASTASATGTIVNDDVATAMATVANVSTTEGNSGATNAVFTVTLSSAASTPVTMNYATSNGTATAGSDYAATSGTLTIAAGQTTGTIAVPITGDTVVEPNETYSLTLSNLSGASFTGGASAASATGTIVNDDTAIATITNVSKAEGNSGTANAAFTVSLSNASSTPVTFNYATSNGTATAGSDYTATTGTLTIAAGQTSGTINVPIFGDTLVEPNETYAVTLSNASGASFTGGASTLSATGTIVNDDVAVATIANVSTVEGNSGTTNAVFTVTLSNASSSAITMNYATSNGTATAGSDYTATSGTLTIAAGQTTGTISVPILGDTTVEPDETYSLTLSNLVGASFSGNASTATATGTIRNDDAYPPPSVVGNDTTVAMGAAVGAASLVTTTVGNGDSVTNYEFLDTTTGSSSGFFQLAGQPQSPGLILDVDPAHLSSLQFVGGSAVGQDSLFARATDGANYGDWSPITVTTQGQSTTPATVSASNASVSSHASVALSSLFSVSDPASLSMKEYQFTDLNTATSSGYLALGGTQQPAGQTLDITAAQLSSATFVGGTAGSSDFLAIRAYNGGSWSAWAHSTITSTT